MGGADLYSVAETPPSHSNILCFITTLKTLKLVSKKVVSKIIWSNLKAEEVLQCWKQKHIMNILAEVEKNPNIFVVKLFF